MPNREYKRKLDALERSESKQEDENTRRCIFTVEQYISTLEDNETGQPHVEIVYTVNPQEMWEALKNGRHKSLRYEDQVYQLQDTVFLLDYNGPRRSPQQRVAHILEIRVSDDGKSCFLRVYYLVTPSEIWGSKNPPSNETAPDLALTKEQAARELVATNKMGIIDVTALQSKADVQQISTAGDKILDGLWWRYKWDVMRKTFS